MKNIIIQTTANNKIIRQAFQALIKSKCIIEGYKVPYIKHYNLNEKGSIKTNNIQILILIYTENRGKSGPKILDNTIKEWLEVTSVFNGLLTNKHN